MKILVLGAGGGLGEEIVDRAVASGYQVTSFVHSPEEYKRTDVRVVSGDARDVSAISAAVQGQDAVLDALGSHIPFLTTTLETDTAHAVIAAMQEAGVPRLIAVSTIGEGESANNVHSYYKHLFMPVILRGVMKDKAEMERVVEESALQWTIVRPAGLKDGPPKGIHIVEPASGEKVRFITRADVAQFMLDQLTSTDYICKTVGIANAE